MIGAKQVDFKVQTHFGLQYVSSFNALRLNLESIF
jgi:hypothetical protein